MSLVKVTAKTSKPDDRLKQAIKEFEAILDPDVRSKFEALCKSAPPTAENALSLAIQIGRSSNDERAQQLAPGLTKVLSGLRTFTGLVDLVIGGSQNLVASAVWGVLKTALETASRTLDFFEKLSNLLKLVGIQCPDLSAYIDLYPNALGLQDAICDYLVVVVNLCKEVIQFTSHSKFVKGLKAATQSFDSLFGTYGERLRQLGTVIDRRCMLALSKSLQYEQAAQEQERREAMLMRRFQARFSSFEAEELRLIRADRQRRTKAQLLEKCAAYSSYASWRQSRKLGNSDWILQNGQYLEWKQSKISSVCYCTGNLGCGKTVIAANVVDDIMLSKEDNSFLCYHFSRYDDTRSTTHRSIIGSIVRNFIENGLSDEAIDPTDIEPGEYSEHHLLHILDKYARSRKANVDGIIFYLVLDGADECDDDTLKALSRHLNRGAFYTWKIFVTSLPKRERPFRMQSFNINIDKDRPKEEIEHYILERLRQLVEDDSLVLDNDPGIVLYIKDKLVEQCDGMLLWASLQLQEICRQRTNEAIRKSLKTLPKGLTATYNRLLDRLASDHEQLAYPSQYMWKAMKVVTVAMRNLTVEELREVLSIESFNSKWDPQGLVNDMKKLIDDSRGLLVSDEEDQRIQLTHKSLRDHILSTAAGDHQIDAREADVFLGMLSVTYLRIDKMATDIAKKGVRLDGSTILAGVVSKTMAERRTWIKRTALSLLRSSQRTGFEVETGLKLITDAPKSQSLLHHFEDYAEKYFLHHTRRLIKLKHGEDLNEAILASTRPHVRLIYFASYLKTRTENVLGDFDRIPHEKYAKLHRFIRDLLQARHYAAVITLFEESMDLMNINFFIALVTAMFLPADWQMRSLSSSTYCRHWFTNPYAAPSKMVILLCRYILSAKFYITTTNTIRSSRARDFCLLLLRFLLAYAQGILDMTGDIFFDLGSSIATLSEVRDHMPSMLPSAAYRSSLSYPVPTDMMRTRWDVLYSTTEIGKHDFFGDSLLLSSSEDKGGFDSITLGILVSPTYDHWRQVDLEGHIMEMRYKVEKATLWPFRFQRNGSIQNPGPENVGLPLLFCWIRAAMFAFQPAIKFRIIDELLGYDTEKRLRCCVDRYHFNLAHYASLLGKDSFDMLDRLRRKYGTGYCERNERQGALDLSPNEAAQLVSSTCG